MKLFAACLSFVCLIVLGCKMCDPMSGVTVEKSKSLSAVVIGMENSKSAGSCPGAEYDATRMGRLLGKYSDDVTLLIDRQATTKTVVDALREAVKSDLCVVYYSGHGGSGRFNTTGEEEVDGRDEYLCLYDGVLIDNEIWKIISKARGRVFLIFDCCHSETMFRVPCITMRSIPFSATLNTKSTFSMLCWSGCPDDTYSYGSASGGEFTNCLLKYFSPTKTYDYLWGEIARDKKLQRFEKVQRTVIGGGFTGRNMFR